MTPFGVTLTTSSGETQALRLWGPEELRFPVYLPGHGLAEGWVALTWRLDAAGKVVAEAAQGDDAVDVPAFRSGGLFRNWRAAIIEQADSVLDVLVEHLNAPVGEHATALANIADYQRHLVGAHEAHWALPTAVLEAVANAGHRPPRYSVENKPNAAEVALTEYVAQVLVPLAQAHATAQAERLEREWLARQHEDCGPGCPQHGVPGSEHTNLRSVPVEVLTAAEVDRLPCGCREADGCEDAL